jgi:hypothetical protein
MSWILSVQCNGIDEIAIEEHKFGGDIQIK